MLDTFLSASALTPSELTWLCAIALIAGVVRGFSGFALSALVMASATIFLPPVALIPVLWFLEMTASLLMVRGGIRDADRGMVTGLVAGTLVGTPIGLSITTTVPAQTSTLIALAIIVALAAAQLARIRFAALATTPGLIASGLVAGIASGLASVGGMVVALYVLARDAPARRMRASLVMFLFASSAGSALYMILYDLWTQETLARAALLIPPTALGVFAGQKVFIPRLERYYRPFCLLLLIVLALWGLVRRTIL